MAKFINVKSSRKSFNFSEGKEDRIVKKYKRKSARLKAKRAYQDEKHGRPKRKGLLRKAADTVGTAALAYGTYKGGKKLIKKGTKMYRGAVAKAASNTAQGAARGAVGGAAKGAAQGAADAGKAGYEQVKKGAKKVRNWFKNKFNRNK